MKKKDKEKVVIEEYPKIPQKVILQPRMNTLISWDNSRRNKPDARLYDTSFYLCR